MHRCSVLALVACVVACSPAVGEPPEPAPAQPVAPSPAPPEPVAEVVPPPAPVTAPAPEPEPTAPPDKPWRDADEPRILAVQPFVAAAAAEHGVDPYLLNGLIWVESKFQPKARNKSGARGLMQLMPTTAKALGRAMDRPAKPYDAEWSVHAGAFYLSRQLRRFEGDETLALAAYASGPGRVREWVDAGEPLPESIKGFVAKVRRARDVFAALGWPEPLPPSDDAGTDEAPAAPGEPEPKRATEAIAKNG